MDDNILITNIQRFCLNDGPGIRTTIFFKGCSVKCPWCCNPENISSLKEEYSNDNGDCKVFGEYYSNNKISEILLKDKPYYNNKGGVTFSGGEALLQFYKFVPLLDLLKNSNINLCLETSLFVDNSVLVDSFNYFDCYIVDIKILNTNKCKDIIGGNLDLFYRNLDVLLKANKMIILRIPVIKGYTDDNDNINSIVSLLKKISNNKSVISIELIKGHNLARKKYKFLSSKNNNIKFNEIEDLSDDEIENYKQLIIEGCNSANISILKL